MTGAPMGPPLRRLKLDRGGVPVAYRLRRDPRGLESLVASPMTLRLAIVGVGDVAERDYRAEIRRLVGRVELVVACSRTANRARDVAERFLTPRWTTSYEEA